MKPKSKLVVWLLYFFFLICLLPVAGYKYKHPAYNFDMLGYMALVVRTDAAKSPDEVHRMVYAIAQQTIPTAEYKKLTDTPSYRKKFATDPSLFREILPNYAVKPLYIWTCRLFYKAGFSLPAATFMPSILAYLGIGLFLFYWLRKYLQYIKAFPAALLIMLSVFTVAIAGLSTPDGLSALFLFISAYFILEKRNISLMFLFMLLAVLSRIDNIITCFFIISFLAFSSRWKSISREQYFLMTAALAITYLCIIFPVRQFGWNIFYYAQYARHIDYARDFNQAVSFSSYLALAWSKLVTALVSTHFTFFMFLGLLILGNTGFSVRKFNFDQSFLLLLLFIIFSRFLLLPDLSDRFYFAFYLIIIILLVRKFSTTTLKPGHADS